MFKNLRKAEGFTLIELIVVIAVLLLLMAIALPSFLGIRNKANQASVKSDLTVAYHDAKAEWAGNESYGTSASLAEALAVAEPGLQFTTGAASETLIKVNVLDANHVELSKVKGDDTYVGTEAPAGVFKIVP